MKSYKESGDRFEVVATASGSASDILELEDRAVVAAHDYANGDTVVALGEGVVRLPKVNSAIAQGAKLYGDDASANNNVSTSDSNRKAIGWAHESAASGDTHINVKLGAF